MLEFIVLGQVPGTHLQITFYGLLLSSLLAGTIIYGYFQYFKKPRLLGLNLYLALLYKPAKKRGRPPKTKTA